MLVTPDILILAAGQGKRMRSECPKVLHPLLGRPLLHYVIETALETPHGALVVVVGHGAEQVKKNCCDFKTIQFLHQENQLGTGHAVQQAKEVLGKRGRTVLVLSGDVPLLLPSTLQRLIEAKSSDISAVVLTTRLSEPTGYGRIIRSEGAAIFDIREEKDCSNAERSIHEINTGIYLIDSAVLFSTLDHITPNNAQREYYLTDALASLAANGHQVIALETLESNEVLGINDRIELLRAERALKERINSKWMISGVTFEDPENTFIDSRSKLSPDVRIEQGCHIYESTVGAGTVIETGCRIHHSSIGQRALIRQGSHVIDSRIGNDTTIGPYAHLRPGSELGNQVKVGNFVEIKNSTFGDESKALHLSYIGDATIGSNVNLGCGFITCNFDGGPQKHRTIIGNGVFVGSDSQAVAPVEIGAGSYVASGTTVTESVPEDSLVISRGRQITKAGYARRYRKGE